MRSLADQMASYAAYHQELRNRISHFVGVPLATFSLFQFFAWFRFIHADVPVTAATVFYLCMFAYYLALDWQVALLQAPFTLTLLWLADRAALLPFLDSLWIFAATCVGGWLIQLLGHFLEGTRPALADNILQIFNAPLFLVVEVLLLLGFRQELKNRQRADGRSDPFVAGKAAL